MISNNNESFASFRKKHISSKEFSSSCSILPDITGRTAKAVRPDVVNAKYHVITNATYNLQNSKSKFSFHINGSAEKDERKWSVSS